LYSPASAHGRLLVCAFQRFRLLAFAVALSLSALALGGGRVST
jgi:hypothetical protein